MDRPIRVRIVVVIDCCVVPVSTTVRWVIFVKYFDRIEVGN